MDDPKASFETLKQLLKNARNPDALNDHPWANSLFVQETTIGDPQLQQAGPGGQLVTALADLFPRMMPSTPPKRGKRIDPRWGEFGLLAALYFTPFNHGTAYPTTLLDAWGRIDEAILYFVYGKPAGELGPEETAKYRLVGTDLEYGSPSTLSDWHRKGLQRFTEIILDQERYLSRTQGRPSPLLGTGPEAVSGKPEKTAHKSPGRGGCLVWAALAVFLLVGLGLASYKGWRVYERGMPVYRDVVRLQEAMAGPREPGTVRLALPVLAALKDDLAVFEDEARPLLWLSPRLGWVPAYGSDLTAAPVLLELAAHLVDAALPASQAALPLLDEVDGGSQYDPASLTYLLLKAQDPLSQSRLELDAAIATRQRLDADRLSPRLRSLLVDDLDPLLGQADEALSLALALPDVLGAGEDGPKTYLILVQNEDELRPTGGFITAFGNLVIHNGQVISLKFEPMDGTQEDWSKPYPAAPWQLQEYMNSPVLLMRDANWFADFPTTVTWAEYLYAYTHDHSVDGVIAFDQRFLVMLLGAIGPVEVEGVPLSSENVVEYMRQAKVRSPEEASSPDWNPKAFIGQIAAAVLTELDGDRDHDWQAIARALVQALDERHLLVQFDDPAVTTLIAGRGWDNQVQALEGGDYLMVTDTNVGFNKTNAVVETSLAYDVDLTAAQSPQSTLTVFHRNNASASVPCLQWNGGQIPEEKSYPIDRCYWSYMRVYKPAGTALLDATPQAISGAWMWSGRGVPARVDTLEEELPGIQAFGTLLVVPGGETLPTGFHFALPATVVETQAGTGLTSYHLKVHKQPGTLAVPLTIRIHLPGGATLVSASLPGTLQDQSLLVQTDLRTDVDLEVVFSLP